MGIKEFNSLVKNLFQTGLKAFSPFRRGERFIFFLAQSLPVGRQDAETQRGIESSPLRLLLPFAKNPPNPLNKGELHPWDSKPLNKK